MPHLCVFCSSSRRLEPRLYELAEDFGRRAADAGWSLVFGGANIGLMDAVGRGFRSRGAEVVAVIPTVFDREGLTFDEAQEVVVTADLRDRKRIMEERSAAAIALPGGPGTADEFCEILTLRQIGLNDKPLVLFNDRGHFDGLIAQLEHMHAGGFCPVEPGELYTAVHDTGAALEALAPGLSQEDHASHRR